MNKPENLRDVICPQCGKDFRLCWNDYTNLGEQPQTLFISSCPSGGVYDVSFQCPHCDYSERL